ncbi:MAG TPA: hypothetical protein VFI73_02195 [Candidatus Nitrosopolaris sp.]|nr:hypothetical protein [Candidatus Nitrosopolaris sp.]
MYKDKRNTTLGRKISETQIKLFFPVHLYDGPFSTGVDKVGGWFEPYIIESMELGINVRIAPEFDFVSNVYVCVANAIEQQKK